MKPRHPIVCLDCAATQHALHRRHFQRCVAVVVTTSLLMFAALTWVASVTIR